MTIPKELHGILAADPNILSGPVRFQVTRVPVQALLDTIIGGETVDYFLDDFPDVTNEDLAPLIGQLALTLANLSQGSFVVIRPENET